MPPKPVSKRPKLAKGDSLLVKTLKKILKEYEAQCQNFSSSPCGTIKEALKLGIEDEFYISTFIMDPKDRKKLEYWNDEKFVKFFETQDDVKSKAKFKKKAKKLKSEKPLVRVLPFIDVLRNNRYTQIKELYVWDIYMDHSDLMCLGNMVAKGDYELEYIEMIDCFINETALNAFAPYVNFTHTLSDLILDFNEFGDRGCNILCEGLKFCRWLVRLSICFCGLHKQSGIWLGNLIAESSIRELFLDGNQLEAEGAIALLTQLAESAVAEGFERQRIAQEKILAAENEILAGRHRVDLDAPLEELQANASNYTRPESVDEETTDIDDLFLDTNTNAKSKEITASTEGPKTDKKRKKKKKSGEGSGKKSKKKKKPPPFGPQIAMLHMAENGINHLGRGGNFAPVRCMQLLKEIIVNSKPLLEIDIFGNEIGQVGGRILLEGILARRDLKLPKIGVRVTHLINQDTFDMIGKLAPGPKLKKNKKNPQRK